MDVPPQFNDDYDQKYWQYLMCNFQRIVTEMYNQCEVNNNNGCCEYMTSLFSKLITDFTALKNWIQLRLVANMPPEKPPFISWVPANHRHEMEVNTRRETSPSSSNASSNIVLITDKKENDSVVRIPKHRYASTDEAVYPPADNYAGRHVYVPHEYGDVLMFPQLGGMPSQLLPMSSSQNHNYMYNKSAGNGQEGMSTCPVVNTKSSGREKVKVSYKSRHLLPHKSSPNFSYIFSLDELEKVYNRNSLKCFVDHRVHDELKGHLKLEKLILEDSNNIFNTSQSCGKLKENPQKCGPLGIQYSKSSTEDRRSSVSEGKFIKDRNVKRMKTHSSFSWARFDVVMKGDIEPRSDTKLTPSKNVPNGNSEIEFPRLVAKTPPEISFSGAYQVEATRKQNFVAALLSNTTRDEEKTKVPKADEVLSKTKISNAQHKRSSHARPQAKYNKPKGLIQGKHNVPDLPVQSFNPATIDEDGWQMVRMKTKREDVRRPQEKSDLLIKKSGLKVEKSSYINYADISKSESWAGITVDSEPNQSNAKCPNSLDKLDKLYQSKEDEFNNSVSNDSNIEMRESEIKRSELDLEELLISEEETRKRHELEEEELLLTRKIKDLELTEIIIENEAEIGEEDINMDAGFIHQQYMEYLQSIPWSDQIEEMEKLADMLSLKRGEVNSATLEQFEELVARYPGRALELHKKMSSRSGRKDLEEKNLVRRQKADEKRQQLLTEKAAKMRELVQKVEEVKAQQLLLAQERKYRLELKLKKAEENRNQHLSIIRRKAHDEEEKLKEIAFINELEAQNRRHESMALRQEQEERLLNILEERQRKVDEKAAKEAAVEERRRLLEAERQEKLEKMQEKRRKKEEIIGRKQREKENERLIIAKEKAREREERLQARHAAQLANAEELQKKIQQKQESSARRHEENIELIRQKALETGSLRTIVNDNDTCQPVFLKHSSQDEVRHRGESKPKKSEFEKAVTLKSFKKRAKKLRMRIFKRGKEYLNEYKRQQKNVAVYSMINKPINEITNFHTEDLNISGNEDFGFLLETITYINSLLPDEAEQDNFRMVEGFTKFVKLFLNIESVMKKKASMPAFIKCWLKVLEVIKNACSNNAENAKHILFCGDLCSLADILRYRLVSLLDGSRGTHCGMLLHVLISVLIQFKGPEMEKGSESIISDFVSYVICSGLITRLTDLIRFATENEESDLDDIIVPAIEFLTSLTCLHSKNKEFTDILKTSDLMGTVSLLYGSLQEACQKNNSIPKFTMQTLQFLLSVADMDIKLFQSILGAEGMYLQLRHVANYLLTVCAQDEGNRILLHLVIEIIGFFAVRNINNQMLLQSGQMPTVLQQLVGLPFKYFCETLFVNVLFPTLIACTYDNSTNRALIENELNYSLLDVFLSSNLADDIKLVRIFKNWEQ